MEELQKGILRKSKMFFYSNTQNKDIFFYPLSAGHFYCSSDYKVERSRFDSILITHIIRGSFSFLVNGKEMTLKPGETAVIDCFNPHTYYTNDSFEAYWIHINGSNIKELFTELISRFGNIIGFDSEIEIQIKDIYNLIKNNESISESNMSSKIYGLIISLFNVNENKICSNTVVQTAINFIQQNYQNKLTIDDISKYINMSPSQFSRQFKKQTGKSPYDYLLGIRLTKAKELLKNTSLPISEISYQTGFANESNFIYFFKRHEGISPLKFRNILF